MTDIAEEIRTLRRDEMWMGMRTTEYAEAGRRAEATTARILAAVEDLKHERDRYRAALEDISANAGPSWPQIEALAALSERA